MKIGFLITYFYPKTGGAENNCYYLAKELAKKHEVHVFCSGAKDSEEIIDNIRVHRCKEQFRFRYYFAFYPSLIKKMLKEELDILHVHGFGFIQHDIAIKRYRNKYPGARIFCTPHGPFMALNKYNLFGGIFKALYLPIIKKSLKQYDYVVEVNPSQKTWLINDYNFKQKQIKFIPNGITPETFNKTNEKYKKQIIKKYNLGDKFVVSYLGRIQKYKGIWQFIDILPKLIKNNPKIVFLAIGRDGGDLERLKEMVKKSNLEDNVVFVGEVSEKEKLILLDISEIFIFPSEWEAFGIATLEAMARKNAVVATTTEGSLYLINEKENGLLFNWGDEKGFFNKMMQLLKSPKLMRNMQSNNFVKAKKFLWPEIAKELEKVYFSAISSSRNI
jgi:glycosyltransferase involved in cell wall biosynthesis